MENLLKGLCGATCTGCELLVNKKCKGCKESKGCPFGKQCWIYKYVEMGGEENFETLKTKIMEEFNSLNVPGMPKAHELFALHGSFVNLEYKLPNGEKVKFLSDDEIYLGNQLECEFNDSEVKKCYGIVANMSFLLVCEYGEDGINPELVMYKRR